MKQVLSCIMAFAILWTLSTGLADARVAIEVGPKFGLNLATLSGEREFDPYPDGKEANPVWRGLVGGFVTVNFFPSLAFQTELLYSPRGAEWKATRVFDDTTWTVTQSARLNYIELPLLLKFTLSPSERISPYVYAGPVIAFNVSSESEIEIVGELSDVEVCRELRSFNAVRNVSDRVIDYALGAGVNFEIAGTAVAIEGRYARSSEKVFDDLDEPTSVWLYNNGEVVYVEFPYDEGAELKNSFFSIAVALRFGL